MLISYPFLVGTSLKEAQDLSDVKEDEARGLFPITTREGWHGGLHLVHTLKPDGVRAIADGTVIAYRVPTARPENEADRKEHALGFNGWTDDGFVLMKHEKECGEKRPVVFYSLYMHLNQLTHKYLQTGSPGQITKEPKTKIGTKEMPARILRKESFGEPGFINGRDKRIHIEIFTDTASLDAFFKPGDGATDPWGDLYFKIPKGTAYVRDPKPAQADGTLAENMLLAVRYADGSRIVTWLDEETGEELMAPRSFPGVENELYQAAKAMGGGTLSRGYEMARFGRLMEWKELNDDPSPATPYCWLELPTGGYVDVAPCEIQKLTDADFPAWKWKKLDATPLQNVATGTWKLPDLLTEVDANGDGTLTVAEVEGWLKTEANRMALRRLVMKAQSEWDGENADDRWGYVKKLMAKDPEAKRAALTRKLAWLEAQRSQAEQALPRLDERLAGWEIRLSSLGKDQDKAKTDAQAAKDREKESDASLKGLKAKTLPQIQAMGKQTWKDQVKAAEEALAEAKQARQRAEAQVEQDERAMAQAKVWMGRDTLKAAAARDLIASEPTRKAALEKDLKALEGATVNEADQKAAEEAFEKFKKHIAALQWWAEVKKEVKDFPASTDVWHFHPLYFIEQMKQCHWLSEDDLETLYPATEEEVREKYRVALSRCLWKYGILGKARTAHFFGQGRVESGGLQDMMELSPALQNKAVNSTSPEKDGPDGFYHDPREWYFTHERHYQYVIGNKEQANLVGKDGKPFTAWDPVIEDHKKQKTELPKERDEAQKKVRELEKALAELPLGQAKRREELMAQKREAQALLAEKKKTVDDLPGVHARAMDKAAADHMDVAKSTTGDAVKFRGRGMKQLTGRANYADYWRYRGTNRFVDEPQRISTVPFNCIDSGSWFFMSRPKGPITKFIKDENDVSREAIWDVSVTINGIDKKTKQPIDFQKRKDATEELFEVVGDEPLEETKMGQAALKAAEQKRRRG